MKEKKLLTKILAFLAFRAKGGVLNSFNSLISPLEYEIRTSLRLEQRVIELLDFLAPHPAKSDYRLVGPPGDGGYVLTEHDLQHTRHVISGGIDRNNQFEIELANMGIRGIQIDNSIESPPVLHKNLEFFRGTLGMQEKETFSINEYLERIQLDNVLVKLDIEGAELDVLEGITEENFKRVNCVVMELHNLDWIFIDEFWEKMQSSLFHLRSVGFLPCFVSANNATSAEIVAGNVIPRNLEVTFTRKENTKTNFTWRDFLPIVRNQEKNLSEYPNVNINHIIFRKVLEG